jgi:hypothetical protein
MKFYIPAAIHIWEKEYAFKSWPRLTKKWMIERGIINIYLQNPKGSLIQKQ